MNKICANGAYSHKNELERIDRMRQCGAPQEEIDAIRFGFTELRKMSEELQKRFLKNIEESDEKT